MSLLHRKCPYCKEEDISIISMFLKINERDFKMKCKHCGCIMELNEKYAYIFFASLLVVFILVFVALPITKGIVNDYVVITGLYIVFRFLSLHITPLVVCEEDYYITATKYEKNSDSKILFRKCPICNEHSIATKSIFKMSMSTRYQTPPDKFYCSSCNKILKISDKGLLYGLICVGVLLIGEWYVVKNFLNGSILFIAVSIIMAVLLYASICLWIPLDEAEY